MKNEDVNCDVAAILVAGGSATRFGSASLAMPKQFELIGDLPMYQYVARTFSRIEAVKNIILVGRAEDIPAMEAGMRELNLPIEYKIVSGGVTRQESVSNGLDAIRELAGIEIVLVHDVARALVDEAIILSVISAIHQHGSAIAGIEVVDTLKRVADGEIIKTVSRENLWRAQTPQGARIELMLSAFDDARKTKFQGTDESQLLERIGVRPRIVPGSDLNFKITYQSDIERARSEVRNL
jgi:2-C-methyl-D-erythritol 4-phosphate cytidylyltransferase